MSSTAIQRVPGRAILAKGVSGTAHRFGYADSADTNPRGGVRLASSVFDHYDNGSVIGGLVAASGAYDIRAVQQDYGAWSAVKGGAWAAWTMLFQGGARASGSTATNAADTQKIHADIAAAWELDDLIQWDMGGAFGRSFLWGAGNIEPDPTGVTLVSAADLFATVEWSPAAAATCELSIRRTDDDNRWIVRGAESGNTIKLIQREAGVETERASASYTWGTTDKTRIWIRVEGTRIVFGTDAAQQGVYTSASFNQTETGVKVSASNTISLANFRAIPLAVPAEGVLPGLAPLNIFPVGDSKTDATTTDSPRPFGVSGGYPRLLCNSVEQGSTRGCYERPARIGVGGGTAVSIDAGMVGYLSTRNHIPDYITVAIGANDAGVAQATFEAAFGSLLDKLHAKWANAHAYCSLPWVQGQDAAMDLIAGYIANVVATRSSWAHIGPDERIVIEGGDDGATNTDDGVHPNRLGHIAWAAAWKTSMGI